MRDINNYIINTIGNNKSTISSTFISFEFNEKFDEICDSNYKKKLEKISTYIKEKKALDKDLDILVCFTYSDGILITFGYSEPVITKRSEEEFEGAQGVDIVSGKFMKTYYGLDEYFNKWKKESTNNIEVNYRYNRATLK